MILWTMDPAERDANLVHEALKKKQRDETYYMSVLIEVSCACTPDHLVAVRRAYLALFGCSVEEDVAASPAIQEPLKKASQDHTATHNLISCSDKFREFRQGDFFFFSLIDRCWCVSDLQMLVRLVSSYRYEGDECVVDMDVVRMEASQLAEAIKKKKQPSGEDEVVRIVTTRSKSQLRATFQRYREDHGSDIAEVYDNLIRLPSKSTASSCHKISKKR